MAFAWGGVMVGIISAIVWTRDGNIAMGLMRRKVLDGAIELLSSTSSIARE